MTYTTYYLGAGASAQSLPVVKNMNARMQFFITRLRNKPIKSNDIDFDQIVQKFCSILRDAHSHASIDTYAKKLFLKGDRRNLFWLKNLISTYFLFEQSNLSEAWLKNPKVTSISDIDIGKEEDFLPLVKKRLDPRYDVFLANFLDRNLKMDPRIRAISWNYDNQFEIAFNAFKTGDSTNLQLGVVPEQDFTDVQDVFLVKLNGSANYLQNTGQVQKVEVDPDLQLEYMLKMITSEFHARTQQIEPMITFAWETGEVMNTSRKMASKVLARSQKLVIVGYTFPVFNREVDRAIFRNHQIKEIYLQTNDKNAEALRDKIAALLQLDPTSIKMISDVEQFFIPYDL